MGGEAVLTHLLAMLSWGEHDECILPAHFLGNGKSTEATCILWGNAGRMALRETAPRDVFGPISPSCIREDGVEAPGDVFGPISPSCMREHGVETPSLPGDIVDFLIELKNKLHFCIYRIIPLLQVIAL